MKFGRLSALNPFSKREVNENVKSGFARLFSEDLPQIIAQPSVKEYYETDVQYPSGHTAQKGNFKERGLQDPYRNFFVQIYAVMFQQDPRFDLESDVYPHGGLSFDVFKYPNEAEEIYAALDTLFRQEFPQSGCCFSACIQDEYKKFQRSHPLDMSNADHRYIDNSMRSIISALTGIAKGSSDARMNYGLGIVKIPSRQLS